MANPRIKYTILARFRSMYEEWRPARAATNSVLSRQKYACCDKSFAPTELCLLRQNIFLPRQKRRRKKRRLSRQKFCRDKHTFVATKERERERERERDRDRDRDRQTDRQTDRKRQRQKQRDREKERQTERQRDRDKETEEAEEADRDKQTDRLR